MHSTTLRRNPFALAVLAVAALAVTLAGAALADGAPSPREAEELGLEPAGPAVAPRAGLLPPRPLGGGLDLLLVPESTNDSVMAFDPTSGALVDATFIPPDPDNLSTPIQAILSAGGDSILVSDQIEDVVQEYDLAGNYIGVFAPAGGPDPAILDNVRGIALRDNGNLLVTTASGDNADAVAEFDTAGVYLGNLVANGDGGLDSPFDVLVNGDVLQVTASTSDAIHEYDAATGAYLGDLRAVDNFPEQISLATGGNLLVGVFGGLDEGVLELDAAGNLIGVYNPPGVGGNNRGALELGNGNILTTNGDGVFEIDRSGALVETEISGVSARFITRVTVGPQPGIDLTLAGACPGEVGIRVEGGTPDGQAAILAGTGPGTDTLPGGPCAGSQSGLSDITPLALVTFDGTGGFEVTPTVPDVACGRYLQVVDLTICGFSDVEQLP